MSILSRLEREALETIEDEVERAFLWEAAMWANHKDEFPEGSKFSINRSPEVQAGCDRHFPPPSQG